MGQLKDVDHWSAAMITAFADNPYSTVGVKTFRPVESICRLGAWAELSSSNMKRPMRGRWLYAEETAMPRQRSKLLWRLAAG
jgi:hypothetical protein